MLQTLQGKQKYQVTSVGVEKINIAQNSATHPGPFLSLVALNLKSRESKDAKQ